MVQVTGTLGSTGASTRARPASGTASGLPAPRCANSHGTAAGYWGACRHMKRVLHATRLLACLPARRRCAWSASSTTGSPPASTGRSRTPLACGSCSLPTSLTAPPPSSTGGWGCEDSAGVWQPSSWQDKEMADGGKGMDPPPTCPRLAGVNVPIPTSPTPSRPAVPAAWPQDQAQVPPGDLLGRVGGAHPRLDQVGHPGVERGAVQRCVLRAPQRQERPRRAGAGQDVHIQVPAPRQVRGGVALGVGVCSARL